jgi:hypothetical protein
VALTPIRFTGEPGIQRAAKIVGLVFRHGADKYPPGNWRNVSSDDHLAAALRHIERHRAGQTRDPESHAPHLAHAAARVLLALAHLCPVD